MDKLESMRVFAQVVERGGFSAAARELGMSRSTVSKCVIDLEGELGVQLLRRTTRQSHPTDAGLAYFERCKTILADIEDAERAISDAEEIPRGFLRINAPMSFGRLHLGAALADFMTLYRQVRVQMVLDDRLVDPVAGGFDVTVRIAEPEDSSLIARTLSPARRVICASPAYLREHGMPRQPEDLKAHQCLHYGYLSTGAQWKLTGQAGDHWIPIDAVLCANNGEILRDAALANLGVALLPSFIVASDLQAGRLATVLDAYAPPPVSIHALYPPSRYVSAKVRVFIDFLAARFGRRPYRNLVE